MSADLFDPLVCESSPILFPQQSHNSAKMKGGYREAYNATIRSKYFYAMLIYLAYAAAMVMNNDIGSQAPTPDPVPEIPDPGPNIPDPIPVPDPASIVLFNFSIISFSLDFADFQLMPGPKGEMD